MVLITIVNGVYKPIYNWGAPHCKDGRSFVSIAAYADPELPNTMLSLLSAAERPELIHFGIAARQMG